MALNNSFDLVFMDMQMPVMDGVEAVKILRHKNYSQPIIALTANAMSESKEKCISIGCNDFLSKPVDRNRLYEMMSEYLRVETDAVESNVTIMDPIQSSLIGDPDLEDIVLLFTDGLGDTCDKIRDALDQQNWEALQDIFHQLKGSGGGVGFPEITEIADKIGMEIKGQKYHMVRESIKEFYLICGRINAGAEKTRMESRG
jgi:CheY-like chemotaxis protein